MAVPKTTKNRPRRAQGAPSRGDMTGRIKATATREAQQADQDRSAELLQQDAEQAREIAEGVFDAQTGERLDKANRANVVQVVSDDDDDGEIDDELDDVDDDGDDGARPTFPQFPGAQGDHEPVFSGQEDPEVIAPIIAERKNKRPRTPAVAHGTMATIRLDTDIEDMTFGMRNGLPNNYTFFEGVAYKVPWALYEHLDNLGVIRQVVSVG